MIRKIFITLFLTAGVFAVCANPQIKFNTTTFRIANVPEGDSTVQAEFKYTNTGTQPLRITNVRVTCGCTVVSYDTVVAPGKTGTIKPAVNVRGFRPGVVSRTVIMTSNAANNPTQTLTIETVITSPLEVSHGHLHFAGVEKQTLWMSTAKRDLNVSGVVFRPRNSGGNPQQWTSGAQLNIDYKFSPTDSVRADGYRVFKLELASPGGGRERIFGDVVITTNHPARREISLVAD